MKRLTTNSYVCMDEKGCIVYSTSRRIRDVPVLVAKAIAGREALRMASQLNVHNLLIKSDSHIVIVPFWPKSWLQVKLLIILEIFLI